jgi:hypothetical protein
LNRRTGKKGISNGRGRLLIPRPKKCLVGQQQVAIRKTEEEVKNGCIIAVILMAKHNKGRQGRIASSNYIESVLQ